MIHLLGEHIFLFLALKGEGSGASAVSSIGYIMLCFGFVSTQVGGLQGKYSIYSPDGGQPSSLAC